MGRKLGEQGWPETSSAESVLWKGKGGSKIHLLPSTTAWIVGTSRTGVTAMRHEEEHTDRQEKEYTDKGLEHGAPVALNTPPVIPC